MIPKNKKFFFVSLFFHFIVLIIFIFSIDFANPLFVVENTNQNDVISAVVLGDSAKSRILPNQISSSLPTKEKDKKEEKKSVPVSTAKKQTAAALNKQKDVIALKTIKKKKEVDENEKNHRDQIFKDLLADIKKVNNKQKKIKQKSLQSQFQKTLHEQAEKSLRQQLFDEEIKLRGIISRQSQGIVNKYKALIMQAISEHWIIPTSADKKAYCELMIRLAPGGMVLDVQIARTSGDPALDYSARTAVLKASPLPVPKDPETFAPFRQFVLRAKPENIITGEVV